MGVSGYRELRSEVIDPGLCVRCGGCVASCPEDVLVFGDRGIELSGACNECGICLRICPARKIDFSNHEKRLFGRSRKSAMGRKLGIFRTKANLRASDMKVMKSGYNGGRISAILIHALERGLIDAALMTDWSGGSTLSVGRGSIARSREDILRLASSKYIFSPVLTLLKEVNEDPNIRSVAVVGLPCHISALRNMEMDPAASRFTEKVRYAFGLHCGNGLLSEEDWRRIVADMTGVSGEEIGSFRAWKIKGTVIRFSVTTVDGRKVENDHKVVRYLRNISKLGTWPACSMCNDYSADLADVSFGWPQTRSEEGMKLIREAVRDGVLTKGSLKRGIGQFAIDIIGSRRKRRSSRREIWRRKKKGLPYPKYL